MPLNDHTKNLWKGVPRAIAQAAAKKSWESRDLPNWRDQVDDLLKGKQIFVKNLRQRRFVGDRDVRFDHEAYRRNYLLITYPK
jgi:hypothetical protein